MPRIAVYPLLLLPNTAFAEERERHGFVTLRGQHDDFEYVLANRATSIADNLVMQRFMYWARLLGENQFFRHVWRPIRLLAGMTQSEVVMDLMRWFDASEEPEAARFARAIPVLAESPAVARGLRALHSTRTLDLEIERWWSGRVVPRFPAVWREFAADLYRYERWCRAVYVEPLRDPPSGWHVEGDEYHSDAVPFSYPVAGVLEELARAGRAAPVARPVTYVFHAPAGFHDHLDNHETGAHYVARPAEVSITRVDRARRPAAPR